MHIGTQRRVSCWQQGVALGSFPVFRALWYLESYCSSVQTLECDSHASGLTSKPSSAEFKTHRKIVCIRMHKDLGGNVLFLLIIIFIYLFGPYMYMDLPLLLEVA